LASIVVGYAAYTAVIKNKFSEETNILVPNPSNGYYLLLECQIATSVAATGALFLCQNMLKGGAVQR